MATKVDIKDIVKAIEEGFYSEAELALRRKVNPRTLQRRNAKGLGPKPTIINNKRLYAKAEVYAWEREQKRLKKAARP